MLKTLLSAVLAAGQVLSASASPLYVCLSRDGSVCVDYGTADCGCCRLDGVGTECCGPEHEHADQPEQALSHTDEFNPCRCNHLQVAELQAATRTGADLVGVASDLMPPALAAPLAELPVSHARPAFGRAIPPTGDALALRASVELRL